MVARVCLQRQQPVNVALGNDALGQRFLDGRQAHRGTDVEGDIAQPVREAEQGLHAAKLPRPADRGQVCHGSAIALHIAHGGGADRAADVGQEGVHVGGVGALGVRRLPVQP